MEVIPLLIGLFVMLVVLFLPGYALTLSFFPDKKEIDDIERITLSYAFAIAVLPLFLFFENMLGIPFNTITAIFSTLLITLLGIGGYLYQKPAVLEEVKQGKLENLVLFDLKTNKTAEKGKKK